MAGSSETAKYHLQKYNQNSSYGEYYDNFPSPADLDGSNSIASLWYPGYTFVEWNTSADGTGTGYQIGDAVPDPDSGNYYAIWEKIDEEDLIISNYSLLDLGDAIRLKSAEAQSPNLLHSYLTIPNMITAIESFDIKKPPRWYKSIRITGTNSGYVYTFNCSNYIKTSIDDYWFMFIGTFAGTTHYYHYYFPTLNTTKPYADYQRMPSSTTNVEFQPYNLNSNYSISYNNGNIIITGNSSNQLNNKKQILLFYKDQS